MPNKSLGQHWLKDRSVLVEIAESVNIDSNDVALEIGPGLGTLTSVLLSKAKEVVAIEYDGAIAAKLPQQFPGKNLTVINQDFLTFDLSSLPKGYKVVANVPYYITTKIIEHLIRSDNQPDEFALLVQKEVAEKLIDEGGANSMLGMEVQMDYIMHLGTYVPKEYFTPVPKVDSQVIVCKKRHDKKYADINKKLLMRVMRAGFSNPRKKIRSSLSAGLGISKDMLVKILDKVNVELDLRAQDLSLGQWVDIMKAYDNFSSTK